MLPTRGIEEPRRIAQNLRTRLPNIKVLYMGAYTDENLLHRCLQGSQASILRKPFAKNQLADAVQKAIDRSRFPRLALSSRG